MINHKEIDIKDIPQIYIDYLKNMPEVFFEYYNTSPEFFVKYIRDIDMFNIAPEPYELDMRDNSIPDWQLRTRYWTDRIKAGLPHYKTM
jgi:hypothetical protein